MRRLRWNYHRSSSTLHSTPEILRQLIGWVCLAIIGFWLLGPKPPEPPDIDFRQRPC